MNLTERDKNLLKMMVSWSIADRRNVISCWGHLSDREAMDIKKQAAKNIADIKEFESRFLR